MLSTEKLTCVKKIRSEVSKVLNGAAAAFVRIKGITCLLCNRFISTLKRIVDDIGRLVCLWLGARLPMPSGLPLLSTSPPHLPLGRHAERGERRQQDRDEDKDELEVHLCGRLQFVS